MKVQGLVPPCTSISRGTGLSGTALYRLVPPRIQKRTGRYERKPEFTKLLVCTSTYLYILVHTDSYQSCKRYVLVLVCTSTYQYRQVQTSTDKYIPVCTGLYWYVLVHTRNSWIQKKCKQGLNPWSCAYFSYTLPLRCECTAREFQVSVKGNVGLYIKLVLGHVRCAAGRPPRRDSETGRDLKVGRFECGSGHGSV